MRVAVLANKVDVSNPIEVKFTSLKKKKRNVSAQRTVTNKVMDLWWLLPAGDGLIP